MPTLKITLEGPPASGKTAIARLIANSGPFNPEYKYVIIHGNDDVSEPVEYGDRSSDSRIEIYCKHVTESS